jgi:hypothetical protein
MDAVLHDAASRTAPATDTGAAVNTQDTVVIARNNTDDMNITNDSVNNLNFNSRSLNEGELPDIDQPLSDESYPSNSAFSFNYENENYDKTPEFDPEWDPG